MLLTCPMHRFAVSDANCMLLSLYKGPFDNMFTLHPKYSVRQYSLSCRQLSFPCVKFFPPEYNLVDDVVQGNLAIVLLSPIAVVFIWSTLYVMLKGHLLNASDGPHFFMHDRLHMNSDRLRHLVIPYVNKTDEKRN